MELCKLNQPEGPQIHGTSLVPLLGVDEVKWPDRVLVTDTQRGEQLVKWRWAAVMTERWRLISPSQNGNLDELELYDISNDPGQKTDVIDQLPEVTERLKAEYERWWKLVSKRSDEYSRIVLGAEAQNPVQLSSHVGMAMGGIDLGCKTASLREPLVMAGGQLMSRDLVHTRLSYAVGRKSSTSRWKLPTSRTGRRPARLSER